MVSYVVVSLEVWMSLWYTYECMGSLDDLLKYWWDRTSTGSTRSSQVKPIAYGFQLFGIICNCGPVTWHCRIINHFDNLWWRCTLFSQHFPWLGLSTVPYMATAVHLMVSIWPRAIPYVCHIHEVESPCQYGMVITMASIWVKMAIWNEVV